MSSFIVSLFWLLLFVGGAIYLAYQRIDLRASTIAAGLAVLAYTIFGEVTDGMDVVDTIAENPVGPQDRPHDPVTIDSVDIVEE